MSEVELNPYLWRDEGVDEFSKFHTRCLMGDNVCSLTIDSRSFVNVVSTWLVERLNLKTLKHPTPYHMRNECGKIMVSEQVLIAFSIGKYQEEVLCDVAPMQTSHILLGRPWHLDRRAKHDEYKNCYSIVINKRRVKLIPLEPMDALDDQLKILEQFRKREREKNEWKELECEAQTSVSDIVEKESEGEEAINKDESFEGREKQTSLSDEKAKNENKGEIKSDICFSTNHLNFSFSSEIDSSLQDLQDLGVQQIPVESPPLEELIPLSVDGFKKERTKLIKQQTKLSNVSVLQEFEEIQVGAPPLKDFHMHQTRLPQPRHFKLQPKGGNLFPLIAKMVKIRGRIFSKREGMIRIRWGRKRYYKWWKFKKMTWGKNWPTNACRPPQRCRP